MAVLRQIAYPVQVRRIARKPVGEMEDLFYFGGGSGQLANAVGKVLR